MRIDTRCDLSGEARQIVKTSKVCPSRPKHMRRACIVKVTGVIRDVMSARADDQIHRTSGIQIAAAE